MTAREPVYTPSTTSRLVSIHTDNSEKEQRLPGGEDNSGRVDAPTRTLSPISSNAMNVLPTSYDYKTPLSNGTIRPVPNVSNHISPAEDSARRTQSRTEYNQTSSSTDDTRRTASKTDQMPYSTLKQSPSAPTIQTSHPQPPLIRQPSTQTSIVRTISAEFGPSRTLTSSPKPEDATSPQTQNGQAQWSSAVGRANLGKSGRVIERLMGENDMLKRDLNLSRLLAEESKQAVKMAEGRMEALTGEYEGRLHDAAINKTLLKRRERQLADLKGQVEGERQRADRAVESERGWREQMERVEREAKFRVEEACTYAALMEGRNKALTSHWKDQGLEVQSGIGKVRREIGTLVEERRQDDERIHTLEGLCAQQAEQLSRLKEEKDGIGRLFERYKVEQEELLRDIKIKAARQEKENEQVLTESRKVLGELKWALGVKRNIRGVE